MCVYGGRWDLEMILFILKWIFIINVGLNWLWDFGDNIIHIECNILISLWLLIVGLWQFMIILFILNGMSYYYCGCWLCWKMIVYMVALCAVSILILFPMLVLVLMLYDLCSGMVVFISVVRLWGSIVYNIHYVHILHRIVKVRSRWSKLVWWSACMGKCLCGESRRVGDIKHYMMRGIAFHETYCIFGGDERMITYRWC